MSRKNIQVQVSTKSETKEEEMKDQEAPTAAEQQDAKPETGNNAGKQEKKVYKKRLVFQSPIGIRTIEVTKEKSTEKPDEESDEDAKPTFKEKFHKFVNGLGTVALVGGIGLAAYGDYKMKKARKMEDEDEDDDYPCEDEDRPEEYDPDSEDDDEDDD